MGPIGDVDEVTDKAVVEEAVVEVAAHAREEQSQRDMYDSVLCAAEEENRNGNNNGDDRDSDKKPSLVGCDTEGGAGVLGPCQVEESVNDGGAVAACSLEPAKNRFLAPQIERQSRRKDEPEIQLGTQRRKRPPTGRGLCHFEYLSISFCRRSRRGWSGFNWRDFRHCSTAWFLRELSLFASARSIYATPSPL